MEFRDDDSDDDKPISELDEMAEGEGERQYRIYRQYEVEVKAYSQMKDLQGMHVPRLYHTVTYTIAPDAPTEFPGRDFQAPGILLQHIPGFPLDTVTTALPDKR